MKINLKELIELYNIENSAIILEPQKDFNGGLIGVTEDKKHFVYSYEKLTHSLAESYKENEKDMNLLKTDDDYLFEACEWVDYNTIRSMEYWDKEFRPIIIYEF